MYLENGRDLIRGILILVFTGVAYWVNLDIGLVLIAGMGALIVQSAFTDWCPADPILKLVGLKKKRDRKK